MSEDGYIFVAAWVIAAIWTLASAAKHGLPPSVGALCALGIPLTLLLLSVLPVWVVLLGLPALIFIAHVWRPAPPPRAILPEPPDTTYLS